MKRIMLVLLSAALLGMLFSGIALSAPQVFSLPWWTVDGGGGVSQGGSYQLSGTIGQADAGLLSGGSYALQGGFWGGESTSGGSYMLHLPLVVR